MNFLEERLEKYVEAHTEKESPILQKLNRHTQANVLNPRMLAGHYQGRLIAMLSKMIQPEYILEIGTYTGYSAICWAEGLMSGGKVITIDVNEELQELIESYITDSGNENCIELIIGNALELIPTLDYPWDIVFLDADKENYINYFEMVIDKVKLGGYIIADNVLWSGKVLDTNADDPDTTGLIAYNKLIQNDARVENILLPVRDGLMIARKK
ncbi:MAG TPA: methyltransferase [Flavobacteriales bacterium]|jgi:caffeoyl-CoA O-methyltransferase|nr:methyltransferase [Flavobacteriales bacterium]